MVYVRRHASPKERSLVPTPPTTRPEPLSSAWRARTLIINAEDFGKDSGINQAVLQSFQHGVCSSTSVMSNMPGFEEASELAHQHGLLAHIGIHLVLRDGPALSQAIRRYRRLCDADGNLGFKRSFDWFPELRLDGDESAALAGEIRAQIARCRQHGLPITHIDSHYHVHNEPAIARIVIQLAREMEIPYVRIARNAGHLGLTKRAYKAAVNRMIERAGLRRTAYFGEPDDYLAARTLHPLAPDESWEICLHPELTDAGVLVANDWRRGRLEEAIRALDPVREAVSFSGARYDPA
jgi:predicted glycoside hydrolase/deacetylase ChbG (UPF0249 family)